MAQSSTVVASELLGGYSDYSSCMENASYTTSVTSAVMNYLYVKYEVLFAPIPQSAITSCLEFRMVAGIILTMRGNIFLSVVPVNAFVVISDLIPVKPNDEQEQDRLDLTHHIYLLLLRGALHLAPVKTPARVLDLGTGTGIWAIDFADQHPGSEITGIDLSPIQPLWIPPNCRFEVDNYEQLWPYNEPFDYIHGRDLEGAIGDHEQLFCQAIDHLKPGGWFEMAAIEVNILSDDETHLKAESLLYTIRNIHKSSRMFGKYANSVSSWSSWMTRAGFVNVKEKVYKLPQGPWSKDPGLQQLGRYHELNMIESLSSWTYALFTRVLGWQRAEIEALLAGARCEVKDPSLNLYTRVFIVYGQKPRHSSAY